MYIGVNKLIEIEHLDWSRQLEKAVRGFHLIFDLLVFSLVSHNVKGLTIRLNCFILFILVFRLWMSLSSPTP